MIILLPEDQKYFCHLPKLRQLYRQKKLNYRLKN